MNLHNATIQELIKEIENQSEFIFVFYDNALDLTQRINLKVENLPVEEKILEKTLESTGNTFAVFDRQIVIGKKNQSITEASVPGEVEAQQKKEITGVVLDKQNQSLPGVSIVIKGTTSGTITDSNGNFRLSYLGDAKVLVFSFVGMKSQEVTLAGKNSIRVILEEKMLD